ncbi:DUF3080 family protein [Alteromonas lipotrueiana]|uniref:DUF3080 family protein n=1 Tax=Alteromonas lipotrueiana TaxID=2803815 RepID=UPI001C43D330|nr:DUF3080 family protein [Alteromonas lipotrueiana]
MRWLVLLCLSTLLTGCFFSSSLQDELDEYHQRLNRVLDSQANAIVPEVSLNYPSSAMLVSSIEPVTINLRDFYRFQNCELGTMVAQRNTALGKTAQLSQRYIYESLLLKTLQQCIDSIADENPEMTGQLTRWLKIKQQQQPALWANLIQTSPEMRAALSRSPDYLAAQDNSNASAAVSALGYLNSLKHTPLHNVSELETQLKIIDQARLPAKLWRTQRVFVAYLEPMNAQLTIQLPQLSCPAGKASNQVKILKNVFYLFFIEKIQPIGSKLNQYHYQLGDVWQKWQTDAALHPSFKRYIGQHAEQGFTRYQQAVKDHVQLWQTLFARCNLSPTAP